MLWVSVDDVKNKGREEDMDYLPFRTGSISGFTCRYGSISPIIAGGLKSFLIEGGGELIRVVNIIMIICCLIVLCSIGLWMIGEGYLRKPYSTV